MKLVTLQWINLVIGMFLLYLVFKPHHAHLFFGIHLNGIHRAALIIVTALIFSAALTTNGKLFFRIDLGLSVLFLISFFTGLFLGFPVLVDELFARPVSHFLHWSLNDFAFHGLLGMFFLISTLLWFFSGKQERS